MVTLSNLRFDNHLARLGPEFSTALLPTVFSEPYLISVNPEVAALFDLDRTELLSADFLRLVSGHWIPPGAEPVSMPYAGHQFGEYVPQVRSGGGILIGQVKNSAGQSWDLQLNGTGGTPHSRSDDGRAWFRSMIREYLASEAMHHLGIPTSRAMAVGGSDLPAVCETVGTEETVGTAAAVLVRVAPSHLRFGSFEIFYYRKQDEHVRTLADYVISRHFPEVTAGPGTEDAYLEFFRTVVLRTARMIASWQAVGFAHGLMNTDNMSILGITFDYGPCTFIASYHPDLICNQSDDTGRYAFSNQPGVAFWNLCCLAQALTPILAGERCRSALELYEPEYDAVYFGLMRRKLGLVSAQADDETLIAGLLEILQGNEVDYTLFFRALCSFDSRSDKPQPAIRSLFKYPEAFDYWSEGYRTRLLADGPGEVDRESTRRARMRATNPRYVLRDWLAQRAIEQAEQKDFAEVDRLLELLRRPYDDQPGFDEYARPAPADARVDADAVMT